MKRLAIAALALVVVAAQRRLDRLPLDGLRADDPLS